MWKLCKSEVNHILKHGIAQLQLGAVCLDAELIQQENISILNGCKKTPRRGGGHIIIKNIQVLFKNIEVFESLSVVSKTTPFCTLPRIVVTFKY